MDRLNHEEFQKVISSSVRIRECPHCRGTAEIGVAIPMYGATGAYVKCRNCGCKTPYMCITEFVSGPDSLIGTPITPNALLNGVLEAVKVWNGVGGFEDGT